MFKNSKKIFLFYIILNHVPVKKIQLKKKLQCLK